MLESPADGWDVSVPRPRSPARRSADRRTNSRCPSRRSSHRPTPGAAPHRRVGRRLGDARRPSARTSVRDSPRHRAATSARGGGELARSAARQTPQGRILALDLVAHCESSRDRAAPRAVHPGASGCHRHRARRPSRIRRRGQRRRVAQLPAAGRRLSTAGSRPAWRHCGARPRVGRPAYARTRRVATSATAVSVTGVSVVSVVVLIISALRDVPLRRQTRSAHGSCGGGPARQEMFRFRRRTAAAPRLPGSVARTPSGLGSVDGLAPLPQVAQREQRARARLSRPWRAGDDGARW